MDHRDRSIRDARSRTRSSSRSTIARIYRYADAEVAACDSPQRRTRESAELTDHSRGHVTRYLRESIPAQSARPLPGLNNAQAGRNARREPRGIVHAELFARGRELEFLIKEYGRSC